MTRRPLLFALSASVFFALSVSPVLAANPPTAPAEIYREDFQDASTFFTFAPKGPGSTSHWGMTTRPSGGYGSTQSLWVAGSNATPTSTHYPDGTAGEARLTVLGLSDYYAGNISFVYLCPSLGGADSSPELNVVGLTSGENRLYALANVAWWERRSFDLASAGISREGINLALVFVDQVESGGLPAGDPVGPSIDDFVVSGYKYGPVQNLAATPPSGGSVTISWAKPRKTPDAPASDERTVNYRAWRRVGTGAWTELTAAGRTAATSLPDSGLVDGNLYQYGIQAWDPGTGAGYGELKTVTVDVNSASDSTKPVITVSNITEGGAYDAGVTPVYGADDNVAVTSLSATLNGGNFISGTPVSQPGAYTLLVTAKDAKGNTATKTVSFSIKAAVTQKATSLTLTAPSSPSYLKSTVSGYLTTPGAAVAGKTVLIEKSTNGSSWSGLAYVTTGWNGAYSYAANASSKTYYRATFAGDSGYAAAVSSVAVSTPKVSLGTPVAPKTMKVKRGYTVYGNLKPRHSAGFKVVKVYKYKKVSGKWKSYGYVWAKAVSYSTYSRFSVKMSLPSKGSWRLRAYAPADSKHAATWSSKYDYVTVK